MANQSTNQPITKERFLKGYPFFISGEPNRVYNYFAEPDNNGFIAENKMYKADVELLKDGFAFSYGLLGSLITDYIDFDKCIDYEFSEFAEKVDTV
jgi:hypothetical protein